MYETWTFPYCNLHECCASALSFTLAASLTLRRFRLVRANRKTVGLRHYHYHYRRPPKPVYRLAMNVGDRSKDLETV